MEKRHNYAAAGFLLLGIGAAGRAFLGVPEGVTMAELSLTVLLVIGALLLILTGVLSVESGFSYVDLNTLGVLIGMMRLCAGWRPRHWSLFCAVPGCRPAGLWPLLRRFCGWLTCGCCWALCGAACLWPAALWTT